MIFTLALIGYFTLLASTCVFIGWGMVELTIEMFKRRNGQGITYYDGGSKFDMASWFDSYSAEEFYGHYS